MSSANFKVMRPSRKRLRSGDVFAMQLPGDLYLFGRVIMAALPMDQAPMPDSNLIYIYRERTSDKVPPLSMMTPDRLLLPPIFINRMPWTRGYFETIANSHLSEQDVLPSHCFRHITGRYYGLGWERLDVPTEPCGDWQLHSYQLIDEKVSDALGYPRPPEDRWVG